MRGWLWSLALVPALAGVAHADRLTEAPAIPKGPSMEEKVQVACDALHESLLSFDAFGLRFDVDTRTANVRVGTGNFRIDGDVEFANGRARVDATIDLTVRGRTRTIELPTFEMVPRSYHGDRYVELRVPLIDRKF